jgi:hypothetical protein
LAYFNRIQHTLDMMIHVTDCIDTGLIASRYYDKLFKRELLAIKNTLTAMSYKYRYQHTVENLPSILKIVTEESGLPLLSNFREISLEKDNNFEHYSINGDIESLKKRLAVIAMEEKRISTNLQSQIALSRYKEIVSHKDCFTHWHKVTIHEKDNNEVEMFFSHFDSASNLPVVYMVEFAHPKSANASQKAQFYDALISDFKGRVSSTLKLITLFKALEDKHNWLQPIRMTRVYIGPFYLPNFTKQSMAFDQLFNEDNKKTGLGCITVEQLKVRNFSVKTGIFNDTKTTEYELDRMRPHLYEAGVTSSTQKVIMPYSTYQALTEFSNHPLSDYQKYVISDNGQVLVF